MRYIIHAMFLYILSCTYRRRRKIRWAKHLRFQPYELFRRNTFAVHWPPVFITFLKLKIHGKTRGKLKNRESLAQ